MLSGRKYVGGDDGVVVIVVIVMVMVVIVMMVMVMVVMRWFMFIS